jgi:ribonucleotide monophosphatase NagD (HAD superfamily)
MEKHVCYDACVTSGEFLRHELSNNFAEFAKWLGFKANSIAPLFQYNAAMFAQSPVKITTNFDEADIIYIGAPRNANGSIRIDNLYDAETNKPIKIEDIAHLDWKRIKNSSNEFVLAEIAALLEEFLEKEKPILIANPDIFAPGQSNDSFQRISVITQGCLGQFYEARGGKVIYMGKPYPEIFEFAKSYVKDVDNSRIVMIGDTPWTDILGANHMGIGSIMTLTGIAEDFFATMPSNISDENKVEVLLNDIALKMMSLSLLTFSTCQGDGEGDGEGDCE